MKIDFMTREEIEEILQNANGVENTNLIKNEIVSYFEKMYRQNFFKSEFDKEFENKLLEDLTIAKKAYKESCANALEAQKKCKQQLINSKNKADVIYAKQDLSIAINLSLFYQNEVIIAQNEWINWKQGRV